MMQRSIIVHYCPGQKKNNNSKRKSKPFLFSINGKQNVSPLTREWSYHCTACTPLAIATEGYKVSDTRVAWKKTLGACHINHHWCVSPMTVQFLPSKTPAEQSSKTKSTRWRIAKICHKSLVPHLKSRFQLCKQTLSWHSVAGTPTQPAWPTLILSATNRSAVSEDPPLLDLRSGRRSNLKNTFPLDLLQKQEVQKRNMDWRLFNSKSFLYIYVYLRYIWFGLFGFYGISTVVGYLTPNTLYTYK